MKRIVPCKTAGDENKQVRDKDDHACDNLTEGGHNVENQLIHGDIRASKRQERGKITKKWLITFDL